MRLAMLANIRIARATGRFQERTDDARASTAVLAHVPESCAHVVAREMGAAENSECSK
jgi:hypothetical protein